MSEPDPLTDVLEATERVRRARAEVRRQRQPSDPNPLPRIRLWGRSKRRGGRR